LRLYITLINKYAFTAHNQGHKQIIDSMRLYVEEQEVNAFESQLDAITAQGVSNL